ncbi:PREDICTED: mediator of RNA polymerase II transcription subunit 9 [Wasmannia auropunctata]|uniref:mediator of RNA polymerase II transcription subunit 9 n=1 Tax=Wasmannia auropunctata TaxID=64793 RepID=UPI0005F06F32|nr:PREDICTED: mediator of RNA polymerase II transcription subunit 9 [Wasmannia auropunctata]
MYRHDKMVLLVIIFSVEKDPHDTTQKAKESQDTSHKILELQKKLDSARSQIKRLPGIEYSKEEQLQKLETLRKQLRLKRELLLKYRNTCTFEIPKV